MSNKTIKPLAAAVGTALAISLASAPAANADASPFSLTALSAGYMGADIANQRHFGEGNCGGEKGEEASCGGEKGEEASCGGEKGAEHSCGAKGGEHSCGGEKGEEKSCGGAR